MQPDILRPIVEMLDRLGPQPETIARLRDLHPELHFTLCNADDIPPRRSPIHRGVGFSLYLVGNTGPCLSLTDEWESASGLVIAIEEPAEE
ncbi:MAG: DUF6129 family protein [Hydrogenophilus sp.]|nr:DUF6129 family protein [Hydrogenophilus sp.]